jgi:hypothetical protein
MQMAALKKHKAHQPALLYKDEEKLIVTRIQPNRGSKDQEQISKFQGATLRQIPPPSHPSAPVDRAPGFGLLFHPLSPNSGPS